MLGKEDENKLSILGGYTLRKLVVQVEKVINMKKIILKYWYHDSKMNKGSEVEKNITLNEKLDIEFVTLNKLRLPLVLAQASPIFHSSCEGKLGIALE